MSTLYIIAGEWLIYLLLISSLSFIVGKTSVWSIGHIAFFAFGQLGVGYLSVNLGWNIELSLLVTILLGLLLVLSVGATTLRLTSDYFIIFSVALVTLIQGLSLALLGPSGVTGVQRLFIGTQIANSNLLYLLVTMIPLAVVLFTLIYLFTVSPFERIAAVVRSNELIAESMGISAFPIKMGVFIVGSIFAVLCGGISATYFGMTDPTNITLYRGILLFGMVLLGGIDSIRGSILGSLIIVSIPRTTEYLFQTPLASFYATQISQLIFGLMILIIIRFLPSGIMGSRKWTE